MVSFPRPTILQLHVFNRVSPTSFVLLAQTRFHEPTFILDSNETEEPKLNHPHGKAVHIDIIHDVEEMEQNGCQLNGCTYNSLLFGLFKSRHLHQALKRFELLKSKPGYPHGNTKLKDMIQALLEVTSISDAMEIYDRLVSFKFMRDYSTHNAVVKVFAKGGNLRRR